MSAKKNFSQAFAGEKTGLCAIEFYFFKLLPALAFEFRLGKRGIARKLVHQLQERLGEFGQAGKGNGAVVGTGVGGQIGAKAAEIFFDLTARAFYCSSA